MPRTLLVVEDDPNVQQLVAAAFDGWDVLEAQDGATAHALLELRRDVDAMLLDVGLPDRDGLEMLGELRATDYPDLPVVILSGRDGLTDRVAGLRLGADDYLTKPCDVAELRARIEVVLRRSATEPPTPVPLEFGDLCVCPTRRMAWLDGGLVDLTRKEFDLLAFLARHPRQVFTRAQLLERVWVSSSSWQSTTTVTEHVRKIRKRLARPMRPCPWIATVRGVGYRFDP